MYIIQTVTPLLFLWSAQTTTTTPTTTNHVTQSHGLRILSTYESQEHSTYLGVVMVIGRQVLFVLLDCVVLLVARSGEDSKHDQKVLQSVSVNKNCARHSLTPNCEMSGRACTVYIFIN